MTRPGAVYFLVLVYLGHILPCVCQVDLLEVQVCSVPTNESPEDPIPARHLANFILKSDITLMQWTTFRSPDQPDPVLQFLATTAQTPYMSAYTPHRTTEQAFYWKRDRFTNVETECFPDPRFLCNPFIGRFFLRGFPAFPLVLSAFYTRQNNQFTVQHFATSTRLILEENRHSPMAVIGSIHRYLLDDEIFKLKFQDIPVQIIRHQKISVKAVLFNQMRTAKAFFLATGASGLAMFRTKPLRLEWDVETLRRRSPAHLVIPVDDRSLELVAGAVDQPLATAGPSHDSDTFRLQLPYTANHSQTQPHGETENSFRQLQSNPDGQQLQQDRANWFTGQPLFLNELDPIPRREDSGEGSRWELERTYAPTAGFYASVPADWETKQQAQAVEHVDPTIPYNRNQMEVIRPPSNVLFQHRSPGRRRTPLSQQGRRTNPMQRSQLSHSIDKILGIEDQQPSSETASQTQRFPERQHDTSRQLVTISDLTNAFRRVPERSQWIQPMFPIAGPSGEGYLPRDGGRFGRSSSRPADHQRKTSSTLIQTPSEQRLWLPVPVGGENMRQLHPGQMHRAPAREGSQFNHSANSSFKPLSADGGHLQRSPSTSPDIYQHELRQ